MCSVACGQLTRNPRLCVAGGCFANSVLNGKIREATPFEEVYVPPAAGDNGLAVGAAYAVWCEALGQPRSYVMRDAYLGTAYAERDIEAALEAVRAQPDRFAIAEVENADDLCRTVAALIADGAVVGWHQGRMEWGSRALGNRSILADPRRADMRDRINEAIKRRESFRPFAPSLLEGAVDDWFAGAVPDPFMVSVRPLRPEKRGLVPAVTHVDGTGRPHTVTQEANPLYCRLIEEFERLTGVPMLLNTSFNESEPIVDTPEQAVDCFLRTGMDALVLHRTLVRRRSQVGTG